MKKVSLFFLFIGLCLKMHGQYPILEFVNRNIDSNYVVSYYNKPNSLNGVIVFEEFHSNQYSGTQQIKQYYQADNNFDKIALEGLCNEFNCQSFLFDKNSQFEKNIYANLLNKYLLYYRKEIDSSMNISNAEYLYLIYNLKLLKTESKTDYEVKDNLDTLNYTIGLFRDNLDDNDTLEIQISSKLDKIYQTLTIEEQIKEYESLKNLFLYYKYENTDVKNQILTQIEGHLKFLKTASIRTDTICNNIIKYYKKYNKLFAIIGAGHSSKLIANLNNAGIPFVVLSEIKDLDYYRHKDKPKISEKWWQIRNEELYLKYLYAYNLNSTKFPLNSTKKIISQFNYLKDIQFNSDKSLTYTFEGNTKTIYPSDVVLLRLYVDVISEKSVDNISTKKEIKEEFVSNYKEYPVEEVNNQIELILNEYLSSEEYKSQKDILKYKYRHREDELLPSNETDWTDKILLPILNKKLSSQIIVQNSISKGKRPDWFLSCKNGNFIGEVKYVRSTQSYEYLIKLLYDDQLEKYIEDNLLNTKSLGIYILVDKDRLKSIGFSIEKILFFKELLDFKIKKLEEKYKGVKINSSIKFVHVPSKQNTIKLYS